MEPGKASNVELLQMTLEKMGYEVIVYHFPDYDSMTGKMIAKYLRGEYGNLTTEQKELISLVYASDRAKHAEDIRMYADNGAIVLLNRYTHSNIYNIAEYPKERWDERMMWTEDLEFSTFSIPKPDYTFFLHVDPETSIQRCLERGKKDFQEGKEDIYESNFDFMRTVSECYNYFCEKKDNWILIDEMQEGNQLPLETVFSKLFAEVYKLLKKNN